MRGLSQEVLAREIGFHRTYISAIEEAQKIYPYDQSNA